MDSLGITKKTLFMWTAVAFICMSVSLSAQITFTDVFPDLDFEEPIYFGPFPGKTETYVVLEQHAGNVLVVSKQGDIWTKSILYNLDVHQNAEMGLLGFAFHPDFLNNRKYYISYDPPEEFSNIVEERAVDETLIADSGEEGVLIFNIDDPYSNHNGGTIAFGPDGYLYFGTGDGGFNFSNLTDDPEANGQNTNSLLAKMLRVDVNSQENGKNYAIPPDNPFAGGGGAGEVFAYGLRNPWKWSFDPLNGDLWVGDVGASATEEVNIITAGGNYGWVSMEGTAGTNTGNMILPVFSYGRADGRAVIGGVVYRANPESPYYGSYFTADYYTQNLWGLKKNGTDAATATELGTAPTGISSFGYDELGRIYAVGHGNGIIYRLDSPDLGGQSTGIGSLGIPKIQSSKTFHVSRGGILNPDLFIAGDKWEMISSNGTKSKTFSLQARRIPVETDCGLYLLRNTRTGSNNILLVF